MGRLDLPIAAPPAEAIADLDADLPKVLQGRTLDEAGWERPDPLTLFIPMASGTHEDGDRYLLRLGFGYYRQWPPSALFVNPETKEYHKGVDTKWLPKIEDTDEIRVHADYNNQGQLICCSTTLEFYNVRHGVDAKHIWDPKRQNFAATLNSIREALRSSYYKGRQA